MMADKSHSEKYLIGLSDGSRQASHPTYFVDMDAGENWKRIHCESIHGNHISQVLARVRDVP